MKVAKFALDSSGRMMVNTMTPTGPSDIAAQKHLMYSACINASGVAAGDHFNGGFRYSNVGALRMHDATSVVPTVVFHNGVAMTEDGEVCYTTDAIGSDVTRNNGVAVDTNGRVYVTDVTPVAWFQYGQGITEAGQGVSVWADQSGNGNDLLQGTDGARPAKQSDGSILFNGTDEFLAATFTNNQPFSVYFLGKQITNTNGDVIVGFGGGANRFIRQATPSPQVVFVCSSQIGPISPPLDTYGVITVVANSTSSVLQLNKETAIVGDAGTTDGTILNVGVNNQVSAFSNIQIKELIVFSAAHSAATRWNMVSYLAAVGQVSI